MSSPSTYLKQYCTLMYNFLYRYVYTIVYTIYTGCIIILKRIFSNGKE